MRVSHQSYFLIIKCITKLSISLFLDLNHQRIAKMNNSSLLQIKEKISELSFKYVEPYSSDKVPQLTKYSFVIIISAPCKDRGEHWIIIAQLGKVDRYGDSLGRKRFNYSFLKKTYERIVHRKLQITDNLCGFYPFFFRNSSIQILPKED